MRIKLNGVEADVAAQTVSELLSERELNSRGVVVQLNEVILERESWDHQFLYDGDKVELIKFVGGGA